MVTITRKQADQARAEVLAECSPELVQERFAQAHAKAKRESQRYYSDFPSHPSEIMKAALWRVYVGGVYDALAYLTEKEPVEEPEIETEDKE